MLRFCAIDGTQPNPSVVVTDIVPPPVIHRNGVGGYTVKFPFSVKCLTGTAQRGGPKGDAGETLLTSVFDTTDLSSWHIHIHHIASNSPVGTVVDARFSLVVNQERS